MLKVSSLFGIFLTYIIEYIYLFLGGGGLGVTNIKHLTTLIQTGTLEYAVGSGSVLQVFSNEANLGILVLSVAKCMFPVRFHVVVYLFSVL
jgi:hypothetical protein